MEFSGGGENAQGALTMDLGTERRYRSHFTPESLTMPMSAIHAAMFPAICRVTESPY